MFAQANAGGRKSDVNPSATSRERSELVAFALLAILPLLPYLTLLLDKGAPRYTVHADYAIIEHDVRHVWSGETLLGLESRFGWHHPGPLFFYLCAPFEWLFRPTSTGLFVGTWFIAAFATVAPVIATRVHAGRAHAIAVLVGFLAWLAAFGNLAVNPWNRTVVVLPLISFLVMMALFAHGSSDAALPGMILGALVAQTHVASASTIGAIALLATIVFVIGRRRGGSSKIEHRDLLRLGATLAALLCLFAPLVVEELRAPAGQGNLSRLYHFARDRREPLLPWAIALKDWVLATSWLPDRLLETRLLDEGPLPTPIMWTPVPIGISKTARALVIVQVILVGAAIVVAKKRRDTMSLSFLLLGVLSSLLAMNALRSIVGEEHHSLVFWAAAPGCLAWMGVVSTFASAATPFFESARERWRWSAHAIIGGGLLLSLVPAAFNRSWLTRYPVAPGCGPDYLPLLAPRATTAIKEHVTKTDAVPVIHMTGAWGFAAAMVLELEKDGVDVRLAEGDAWWFAGAKTPRGARAVHFYFDTQAEPVLLTGCLDHLADLGGFKIWTSSHDVTRCD